MNPVRAEIVDDPKAYRWSGYGEAVGGSKRARRGLCRIMEKPLDSWLENGSWYRCWLLADGEEVLEDKVYHVNVKKGMSSEKVEQEFAKGGEFSRVEDLRNRVSYFTQGLALGSKEFVERAFTRNCAKFGPTRKKKAKSNFLDKEMRLKQSSFYTIQRGR